MVRPSRVIIDTDPGVDDAIAILMALASPGIDLAGLTTVGGNVPVSRGTRNALALLQYAGRQEVPVAQGAARPCRGRFGYSYRFHGLSGISRRLPEPRIGPLAVTATEFLASKLQSNPGQITVAALGPLTNLANLLDRHPAALGLASSLVVMGGAVECSGNVTPHAEFNFYSDPAAAHAVLSSGVPLTLIDLDASRKTFVTREAVEGLKSESHLGRLAAQLLSNWFNRDSQRERFEFYDPLALAVALEPGLVTTRRATLEVETFDPSRMGQTRIIAEGGPVAVVKEVDVPGFFGLLQDLFRFTCSNPG